MYTQSFCITFNFSSCWAGCLPVSVSIYYIFVKCDRTRMHKRRESGEWWEREREITIENPLNFHSWTVCVCVWGNLHNQPQQTTSIFFDIADDDDVVVFFSELRLCFAEQRQRIHSSPKMKQNQTHTIYSHRHNHHRALHVPYHTPESRVERYIFVGIVYPYRVCRRSNMRTKHEIKLNQTWHDDDDDGVWCVLRKTFSVELHRVSVCLILLFALCPVLWQSAGWTHLICKRQSIIAIVSRTFFFFSSSSFHRLFRRR